MKITNSVALVTGANRGIGRAFVEWLSAEGGDSNRLANAIIAP